jgi:aminotransferase
MRRQAIVSGLNRLGLDCHLPEGAFYAFPSIERTGLSAQEFATRLLYDARVALVPGDAFGPGGDGHVRCAYATGLAQIEQALQRIERFLHQMGSARDADRVADRNEATAAR